MEIIRMTKTMTEHKRERDGNEMSKNSSSAQQEHTTIGFHKGNSYVNNFQTKGNKMQNRGYIFKMEMLQLVEK